MASSGDYKSLLKNFPSGAKSAEMRAAAPWIGVIHGSIKVAVHCCSCSRVSDLTKISRFVHARFSPEGYAGLHLTIGAVLLIAASAVFGTIAKDVASADAITLMDVEIARWLHAHADATLTRLLLVITNLHSPGGVIAMSIAVGVYFALRKSWYWLLSLVVAVAGGALLNIAMKYAFHRARPIFDDPLLTLATYSFPSGHTAGSTLFYGLLACYLFSRTAQWPQRALIILAAVGMVLLVGLSRMYLGVHYFTDVLGAIAEAAAWLTLTVTAVSTLRRRRLFYRQAGVAPMLQDAHG